MAGSNYFSQGENIILQTIANMKSMKKNMCE